jgi:hypothetical protein
MGRHRRTARFTVEECLALDVESLHRSGTFACPPGTIFTSRWETSWGGIEAMLAFVVVRNSVGGLALFLDSDQGNIPPALKLPGKYLVPIATTRPHLGGRRFWFCCPAVRDGKPCGKLAGRLYLRPGQTVFACRACHNLTYQSAQQHDQRKYDLARDPVALRAVLDAALRSPNAKKARLAFLSIGAQALCVKRLRKGKGPLLPNVGDDLVGG